MAEFPLKFLNSIYEVKQIAHNESIGLRADMYTEWNHHHNQGHKHK